MLDPELESKLQFIIIHLFHISDKMSEEPNISEESREHFERLYVEIQSLASRYIEENGME